MELPAQKNNRWRKLESGGGLGQIRKRDEEKNPDMKPLLRVM